MNKATFSALAVMIAAGLAVTVDAQARERSVNERQSNQRERVVAGARSGALTRPETRQLNREARGIERKEQVFRSDGQFSRGERREVQRDLNRHNRNIHQARTDHERRDWGHSRGVAQSARGWHGGRDWGHDRGFQRHGARSGNVDRLQQRQQAQIRLGVRNGSLTPPEARRLRGEQREIAALERSYRADGVLTRSERRDLRGELQDANRHIYNQAHDDDRRYVR